MDNCLENFNHFALNQNVVPIAGWFYTASCEQFQCHLESCLI